MTLNNTLKFTALAGHHSFIDYVSNALICGPGLRKHVDVPRSIKTIYVHTTENKPRHSHWFGLKNDYCEPIDFSDDELGEPLLDFDFKVYLRGEYKAGARYVTIEYEE